MATFLQLCQSVFREGGLSGQITTVVNQNGEALRVVKWVADSYKELLQEEPTRWWFLRRRYLAQLEAGKGEYTPAELGITDLASYDTQTFRVAVNDNLSDETFLYGRRWPDFRDYWRFSSRRAVISRPLEVAVTPELNLAFGPIPESPYWCQFEYVINPPELIEDNDVPLIPERFQIAIMWLALRHYGMFESAPEVVMRADANYNEVVTRMFIDQTDEIVTGGPLC